MIGVVAEKRELETVKEFFELFKTPWELYRDNHTYDVVLTTSYDVGNVKTRLLVVYGSEKMRFDSVNQIELKLQKEKQLIEYENKPFPVFGKMMTFGATGKPLLRIKGTEEMVGIEIEKKGKKIFRIGFDLFQEVSFLLSSGQESEFAYIPTLEMHIAMLRNLIVGNGIFLVEVPPIPDGHNFMACLTHDVDFVGIKKHKFDHTMFGFIYRALIVSLMDFLIGRISSKRLLKNWISVVLLPGVYLGIVKDFMLQFNQYLELEKDLGSTFYIIPFKKHAGKKMAEQMDKRRASKYDVSDIEKEIQRLMAEGCEIGLHGIDAWHDTQRGREEFQRIFNVTENSFIGVRMHWLYYKDYSPKILESVGFLYDSTFGYNDAVGFKGGTSQIFRPVGAKRVFELPLHIQDTALFFPKRMSLAETDAMNLAHEIMENVKKFGGVLTINWHQRSLGPERLWGDFYNKLLAKLKKMNVWFATARQAVEWFKKRRSVSFEEVSLLDNSLKVKLSSDNNENGPDLLLRIHLPKNEELEAVDSSQSEARQMDIPFTGKLDFAIPLKPFDNENFLVSNGR